MTKPTFSRFSPLAPGAEFHEALAADWDAGYNDGGFRRRFRFVERLLQDLVEPGSTWLDLGCGAGTLTCCLDRLGANGLAVDGSPAMIRVARERHLTAFQSFEFREIETVERLLLQDRSFDGVLCSSVVEYVDAPAQALEEIARVLKPGGRLLLSVANRRSLLRNAQYMLRRLGRKPRFSYLDASHTTYSRAEIRRALKQQGICVDATRSFDPILPTWSMLLAPAALFFVSGTKNNTKLRHDVSASEKVRT